MTMTIELTPEQAARLGTEAEERGVQAERYAVELLDRHLAISTSHAPALWDVLSPEAWKRETDAWIAGHDSNIRPLTDYAVSRESFYEGRP